MSELIEIQTADLTGAALDWAVMVCVKGEKTRHEFEDGKLYLVVSRELVGHCQDISQPFMPSTRWQEGGPLIGKYMIAFACFPEDEVKPVWAYCCSGKGEEYGPTHLIAACRAIVASKFGDTVSVPKELCQ
jgi:hypothetical protein